MAGVFCQIRLARKVFFDEVQTLHAHPASSRRYAGQWFVRHGTSPIVMTQNQVRVFFRSYRCPFAWFVRLVRHHSQVAFLAFVVDVALINLFPPKGRILW